MNMNDQTKNIVVFAIIALVLLYLWWNRVEGYERTVVGGDYGAVQNEIFWYPYPTMANPTTRHVKYDPNDRVHSVSYAHPDFNTTVNEPHGCAESACGRAFANEDVKCHSCPQYKRQNSF